MELSQQFRSADIALYSLNGKQVLRGSGEHPNLAMGVYLLSVRGRNGSVFTARFAHSGGGLSIDVGFGNGNSGSLLEKAIAGNWTITVSAEGYLDTSYAFFPETGRGSTPVQEINLRQILPSSSSEIIPSSSSETSSSSSSVGYSGPYGSVTHGGQTYKTIVIGTQTWMAENLNYDPGPGNSACYDNNSSNCAQYGRLYDWSTAMSISTSYNSSSWNGSDVKHQGICPAGWHLPSNAEWTTLTNYVGGTSTAGTKLKATTGWNNNGNGTDEYGFSTLPGGRGYSDGNFNYAGDAGNWWSSTEDNSSYVWYRGMYYYGSYVGRDTSNKSWLFSVRCLKD